MDTKITIAQPYCVLWKWQPAAEATLIRWVRENIKDEHECMFLGQHAQKIVIREDEVCHENMDSLLVWHFKCPRDALLFKLTWGGS